MAEKVPLTSWTPEEKIRRRKKNEEKLRFTRLIPDQRSAMPCSTIPEGEILHSSNLRRTSLSIPCPSASSPSASSSSPTNHSFQFSRKKFQSFYRSFIPSKSSTHDSSIRRETSKMPLSFSVLSSSCSSSSSTSTSAAGAAASRSSRQSMRARSHRYSLPDTSTRTLILKNLREKNGKMTLKSSASPDDSLRSTFHNLLSLVKFPSTRSTPPVVSATSVSVSTSSSHIVWHFHADRSEWFSSSGIGRVRLSSIELHNLTTMEVDHLQKIIFDKFDKSTIDLHVPWHLFKEGRIRKRKHHFMFRSKSTDKSKDTKANGNVFGIALADCVQDEQENRSDAPPPPPPSLQPNKKNEEKEKHLTPSASSSSINDSGYSLSPTSPSTLQIVDVDYQEKKYRSVSLEALGLPEFSSRMSRSNTLRCYPAKVPELIRTCCDYLEQYGLHTVGLFRVGVSKKRLKELKDQINSSRTLTIDASTNVHDIAGLIKEFLRELPEPLLTRHLSLPFIHIRTKVPLEDQNEVLADLIRLLPSSNRDTLYQLLKFLHHVSLNSQDRYASDGTLLSSGNKMDTENLAIVFAPTILLDNNNNKTTTKDTSISLNTEQIEQGKDILKLMIDHYKDLFMINKSLHDQICFSISQLDHQQFTRLLAFKVQNRCGVSSMELDDENESFLLSIDLKALSANETSSETNLFDASLLANGSSSSTDTSHPPDSTPRRYNLRRNSDFPSSSSHSSRSAEYLQVPLSKSQQRLSSSSAETPSTGSARLRDVRDIREARMDQLIFRLIDPTFAVSPTNTNTNTTGSSSSRSTVEPIINITSPDDPSASVVGAAAAAALATAKATSTVSSTETETNVASRSSPSDLPSTREVKSYARSKTAPLAFSTAKKCQAKDLCGSSSNDSTSK